MDARLATLTATRGGIILRRQALAAGYSDQEINALCRSGAWGPGPPVGRTPMDSSGG
jgi:hypothetical protein